MAAADFAYYSCLSYEVQWMCQSMGEAGPALARPMQLYSRHELILGSGTMTKGNHVIIIGCGRSGTSVFGELFESLSFYRYYFEPTLKAVSDIDFFSGPVAMKVPKAPPGTPMTPGLPFLLEELLSLIPAPRTIFWQARHPLDAICSLQPGIAAGWCHNPKPPDWEAWLELPLIERCARHWSYINTYGFTAVRDLVQVNRYEDLIADPLMSAETALKAANIDVTSIESQKGLTAWCERVGNKKHADSYEAKHQVRWSTTDHSVRVGRWRENLTAAQLSSVIPIVAEGASLLNYELPADLP